MYSINFKFEEKDKTATRIENCPADDSILEIALKNNIHLHHNCGGVSACSTCHIYLEKGENFVEEITDKEEDFIDRARNPKLTSRLSCQCLLLEGAGEIDVIIPDQSLIHGE
jgi:2Fe-2S ferredoxin